MIWKEIIYTTKQKKESKKSNTANGGECREKLGTGFVHLSDTTGAT